MCAYQGVRNVSFLENFGYILYGLPLIETSFYYRHCSNYYIERLSRLSSIEGTDVSKLRKNSNLTGVFLFGDISTF